MLAPVVTLVFAAALTLTDPFVVDGDTVIGASAGVRETIRIEAIDAPELGHPQCPSERLRAERAAREAWRMVLAARVVTVEHQGRRDRYGRLLGRVRVDGTDLGEALVAQGLAVRWEGRRHAWCAPGERARERTPERAR